MNLFAINTERIGSIWTSERQKVVKQKTLSFVLFPRPRSKTYRQYPKASEGPHHPARQKQHAERREYLIAKSEKRQTLDSERQKQETVCAEAQERLSMLILSLKEQYKNIEVIHSECVKTQAEPTNSISEDQYQRSGYSSILSTVHQLSVFPRYEELQPLTESHIHFENSGKKLQNQSEPTNEHHEAPVHEFLKKRGKSQKHETH
jgi:hypothetical protein